MARTDRDRWDLATSVGATATMVAAQRALSSDEKLIDDPYAAPLVRAVGIDVYVRLVNGQIPVGGESEFDPQRMARGMACRTRFYDRFFLDAAQSGIDQAVILAAGLDARAYRLPWPAGTVVYEVDQPEVIEFKTKTLADLGAEPTATRRTIAIDLRDDWPQALLDNGFDRTQPTAWSAEGLLIYLPPQAQDLLFDNITKLSAPGSRLATEHIPDFDVFEDERSQRIAERLKQYGHDIQFSDLVYHGERSHVIENLTALGGQVAAQKITEAYTANGFTYPDDETMTPFSNLSYVSAVLGS